MVISGSFVIEEVFPVEAVDEEVHLSRYFRMDVVVVHPVHQDLQASAPDLGASQQFIGDVGVDEGIEEDVGVGPVVSHYDLVYLSEFLENACYVIVI